MNIDKMEAGREMDAAVVRDVFKLRVSWWSLHPFEEIKGRPYRPATYGIECLLADDKGDVPTLEMLIDKDWEPVPPLSTDIAAAWLVEERIAELGLIGKYCKHLNAMANDRWDAGEKQGRSWQLIHAPPEDRCRAALKAVEE